MTCLLLCDWIETRRKRVRGAIWRITYVCAACGSVSESFVSEDDVDIYGDE